ncbi:hypothetical protein PVAP13_8NG182106 [Panicum virgatum]|uniref:BLE2 protein n=1 Tax=Panicum virgatum TaxID=38727 RepID=A0A8T0PCY6_PANVG|nr:hypothetical protein PVAP13_8NG182106 [Panicum virgatum]
MAQSTGGEHHVRVPAHSGGQAGTGDTPPEKQLNSFVRAVALIERLGNALGTLAFTWATVVLLGGYPAVLRQDCDFWFATTIVFLEAARMFSRNNKLDYQLFFYTRGAFKPLGWNGLTVVVIFTSVLLLLISYRYLYLRWMVLLMAALVTLRFVSSVFARLLRGNLLRRAISLLSPFIPILFLGLTLFRVKRITGEGIATSQIAKLVVLALLFLVVLLLTISRLRFPSIINLVKRALGSKQEFWHRIILNSCMLTTGVLLAFVFPYDFVIIFIIELVAVAIVSLGNLQIPAAIVRVVLALIRLIPHDYYGDDIRQIDNSDPGNGGKINLAPSLNIFYGMVLGQGTLYSVACILELFSFIPRRSLARRGGFGGQWGVESVNLYYAYAFEKYMQGDVLAPKNINLNNFAVDSINSETPKMQFHGIRMMHCLLQKQPTRRWFILKLNGSMETMVRLINMLDWTSPEDTTVRLFAAKVTAELATSIRVVTIPGIIQVVSALLGCGNQQKRGNPLLDSKVGHENNQEGRPDAVSNTGRRLMETQDRSTQQVGTIEQKSRIFRCCQGISKLWSIPQEEPLTEQDLLPALAMLILDGLASFDQGNCMEISKASGLIPKIIAFTSCRTSGTTYTDAQRKVLVKSSVKLLHRLTSVEGEIGITLRHKVSKYPFLLRNLAEILGDGTSSQEVRTLAEGIIRNLAIDENTRQVIGHIQVIITLLMQAFLKPDRPSSTDADKLLREVAGQALAMLAMDNVNNCLAMLGEAGHEFIEVLTSMIHMDRYRCVAASLLRNICQHARPELKEPDLKELSYCLRQQTAVLLRLATSNICGSSSSLKADALVSTGLAELGYNYLNIGVGNNIGCRREGRTGDFHWP